jgi:hypothetical protein
MTSRKPTTSENLVLPQIIYYTVYVYVVLQRIQRRIRKIPYLFFPSKRESDTGFSTSFFFTGQFPLPAKYSVGAISYFTKIRGDIYSFVVIAGVVVFGHNLLPVSLTPVFELCSGFSLIPWHRKLNLSLVTTTTETINRRYQQHRRLPTPQKEHKIKNHLMSVKTAT